jgi:PAS domain-containing protein
MDAGLATAKQDTQGRYDGSFAMLTDITEWKQAEESLRQRELFIRTVMDHLPIGIAVNSVDPDVTFEYMNDNFPKIYRTTKEALCHEDAFWDTVTRILFSAKWRQRSRKTAPVDPRADAMG